MKAELPKVVLFMPVAVCVLTSYCTASDFEVIGEKEWSNEKKGKISVIVVDAKDGLKIPVRVVVRTSDGSYCDGSGRGVYRDGRFYANGEFSVEVPQGETEISLSSGPNYIPLKMKLTAKQGKEIKIVAKLEKWFSPQDFGWFCGDNHVHVRHDPTGEIKIDEEYAILQAKAEGLDCITEADAGRPKDVENKLSTQNFLFRQAVEIRPGCFVGHVNTPGIIRPLYAEELRKISKSVLPIQALCDIVHDLGGIVIYTHTLPMPRLHWMGATESISDVLLGKYADAFDISNEAEEALWFALLNLGAKIAVSGSTDTALIRRGAIPPGSRRVYAKSGKLDYSAIVDAMRRGKTFATNGGPIFPFFTIDGHEVGETIKLKEKVEFVAQIQIFHLYPLRRVELIRNGSKKRIEIPKNNGNKTTLTLRLEEHENAWYALRVEDENGNWAITSPIYFETLKENAPEPAFLIAFEIGNFARFVELRKEFFAHVIVTARGKTISRVALMRDNEVFCDFYPENGNYTPSGKTPVVELGGEYSNGWMWHPNPKEPTHFVADILLNASGWYRVLVETKDKISFQSEAIHFDMSNPNSHQISALLLHGGETRVVMRGYGEEMPLNEVKIPFKGDHWWYPKNSFWEIEAKFGDTEAKYSSGWKMAREKFK